MAKLSLILKCIVVLTFCAFVSSCARVQQPQPQISRADQADAYRDYSNRVPQSIDTQGNKLVLVDPNTHAWGAYGPDGNLVRAGIATSGGTSCPSDAVGESNCRTDSGVFKITRMEGEGCYSKKYPRPTGGGLMPYCMFFSNGQALHGSPDNIVVDDNISHGCVRMRIPDAEWMQTNFAQVGTRVMVLPYNE